MQYLTIKFFLCLLSFLSNVAILHIIHNYLLFFQTGDVLLVKTLLAFGANINEQGLNDFTPLDLAIHNQSPEVEALLLEHGAKSSANLIAEKNKQVSTLVEPL